MNDNGMNTDGMRFIALPTVYSGDRMIERREAGELGRNDSRGPPYKIYAIPNVRENRGIISGEPPYFKVTGMEGDDLSLEELVPGSDQFNRVLKWVGVHYGKGQRKVLNVSTATCNVTKKQVMQLLSQ